jgi:predicted CXXCH cytochrome family protein
VLEAVAWSKVTRGVPAALLVLAAGYGCIDEKIVFRDRELFNQPLDSASGMLGYYRPADRQTTCGNCHVSFQRVWAETRHARAYADLVKSGVTQAYCFSCHTTNEKGNVLTVAAGYNVKPDSVYYDVQCESCHGPGFVHVQSPSRDNWPLATIKVDTGLASGCGECHSGIHTPFVEQWKESAHGSGPGFSIAAGRAECAPCHEGRAALAVTFGSAANYVEKTRTENQRIVCATCHNPHGSPYEHQLRAPLNSPTRENLCVKCHSRTGTPTPPTFRGPHAAQGLLLLGENVGWYPPGFQYDTARIVGTHGTAANSRLCATCHVTFFEVRDKATGQFLLRSVGHTFEAIQCLDANGLPKPGPCSLSERNFKACATSGCHGSESAARSAFRALQARLEYLLDQLWFDSDSNRVMDPTDTGLLPRLVARARTRADSNQLNLNDAVLTVAEGAMWNAQLAAIESRPFWTSGRVFGRSFSAHYSAGEGVHNPFLLEALLIASINAVIKEYGLAPPAGVDLEIRSTPPPGLQRVAP